MFRHQEKAVPIIEQKEAAKAPVSAPVLAAKKEFTLNQVGELLEKNLKWSQIIYEQNRKINRKLFISSLFSWVYFIIIVAPIILAVWFLPPVIKNAYDQYKNIFGTGRVGSVNNKPVNSSLDQVFKLLNLDAAQEEQVKALLK